jgi:hypothetical protein
MSFLDHRNASISCARSKFRSNVRIDEAKTISLSQSERNKQVRAHRDLPGYTYDTDEVAKSPMSLEAWEALKKSARFSEEDVVYLRLSHDILVDQVDDLLKVWRGVIFDHPHFRADDENPSTGEVDQAYAQAVGRRFGQRVLDTALAKFDQKWLDYQYEIGLRHHRTKKNQTDHGRTLGHIRARDLIAFSAVIVTSMKALSRAQRPCARGRRSHV